MSEFAKEVSGIPPVGSVLRGEPGTKTTAGIQVQRATYLLSKAIFEFSPPTFALNHAIREWKAQQAVNLDAQVPETPEFETRVGASLALLGYLQSSATDGLTAVLAASGTLRVMEPVLSRHLDELRATPLVLQTAALDYDAKSGELVSDYASVLRVSRSLDLPLVASSLYLENDAFNSSVLASVLALCPEMSPVIHLYDGLRGTRQAYLERDPAELVKFSQIKRVNSVADAFEVANELLHTSMRPFEYFGPSAPQTVYVTLGDPQVLSTVLPAAENSAQPAANGAVGVLNVRLYRPFQTKEFLQALPKSAVQIVVVSESLDLFTDVNVAVRQHFGFRSGPSVTRIGALDLPTETSDVITVWDSDRSITALTPARFANAIPEASLLTRFDNCVAGGAIAAEIRPKFAREFWTASESALTVVLNADVLQSVDVSAHTSSTGRLVIAAGSDDELSQKVPAKLKQQILAKQQQVLRLDLAKITSRHAEGRATLLATQAALWLLTGHSADLATSRVVHANSNDTELVAAVVSEIVAELVDGALAPVNPEVLQSWTQLELSERDTKQKLAKSPLFTSFAPVKTNETSEPNELSSTTKINAFELQQRLLFSEAFATRQQLRPDAGTRTVVAKVKLNQRVTPLDYDRHIFQLELDIAGTGLQYNIGEALGVHAPNPKREVLEFLEFFGTDPDSVHALPSETPSRSFRTAYQIARDHLDLFGKVPKRFYEGLLPFATSDADRAKLAHLLSSAGAPELKQRSEVAMENYVDVLREFSSAKPSFGELVALVAPLKRREYSIASSQRAHPTEVHLLVVVVDWTNANGEKRYGQCSRFLSQLAHGDEVVVSVKPSVLKLPQDPKTPIIMAGLGTGLAPFKAFLEEKQWQREQGLEIGSVFLFLGSRHQRQEYLYGELFEAYKSAGVLTHIGAAFSRDQPEKIYIQHRIQQAKSALATAFVEQKGNFYLCGPTWPVPDISAALAEIVREGSSTAEIDEGALIEELKEAERYVLEVY